MRQNSLHFYLAVLLCLAGGCVNMTTYDSVKRPPTTQIDIFRDGTKPSRPYREIGTVGQDVRLSEQAGIEKRLVEKAKAIGANAIILQPATRLGESFRFIASIIAYE